MTAPGGLDSAAASILKQAVDFDNKKRFLEALTCYREGIEILLKAVKNETSGSAKQTHIRAKIEEYMKRAEQLKKVVEQNKANLQNRKQTVIKENEIGYSYEKIFSPFLNETVEVINVADPYIRANHQLMNFLRFCELVVRLASNLRKIILLTGQDDDSNSKQLQKSAFAEIEKSLKARKVDFNVSYSNTLHDREIKIDESWVIKIGRGLDYFKPLPKFALGFCDYNLRPCYETTVDVFHNEQLIR